MNKNVQNEKKNASWGNSFRLLLPSVIEYFFPPFTTQEKSKDIKKKTLNH